MALVFLPRSAGAEESVGKFEMSDLLIEPTYTYQEPNQGRFTVGSSYAAFTWTRDSVISAVFKAGTKDLIGHPARYGPALNSDQLGIIEGYGQADSVYGRIRLGMIPVPYGLEGGDAERHLRLPRSLIFQARYVPIRDYGASYRISHGGFFSDWAIHNGEGGTDVDNESWFTARIGWQGGRFFRIGASGMGGRTSPKSTNPSGTSSSTAAWLDVDKSARFRIVNGFLEWQIQPVTFSAESTAGDAIQDDSNIKTRALHADLEVETGSVSWLARYDIMDPRNDVGTDQVTEYTAGFAIRTKYDNSVLYVLGTKKVQQDVQRDEHRGMILWRLTPLAVSRASSL